MGGAQRASSATGAVIGTRFATLRKVASSRCDAAVWVDGKPHVNRGERVTLLRSEGAFVYVRTASGAEGFVKFQHMAPHYAVKVRRGATLRKRPDPRCNNSIFVAEGRVTTGESVEVLSCSSAAPGAFAVVRRANGTVGFIKLQHRGHK